MSNRTVAEMGDLGGVSVREVRADEADALGRVTREAFVALGQPLPEAYLRELADVASRAQVAAVLVALGADGEILGGVTYVDDPANPFAEFTDAGAAGFRMLAVATSAQGRGVGEALVRACVARARTAGRRRLVLHSATWMVAAHRLYRRLGFVRDPALDWEPTPGVALWGFALDLVSYRGEEPARPGGGTGQTRLA